MLPLFILGFLIRLIAMDQSLWLDEGTSAKVVSQYGLTQIVSGFSPHDFHPPLYYLLLKLWTNIFGYSEIALRFPSLLFSLLAGWFVYLIGKQIKDKKTGMWAATFFLFNPLIIYYSQEARMYMMVTAFLAAALYFLLRNKKNDFVWVNIFLFLSFLTFYGSIFFIAALYVYLIVRKQFRALLVVLPGFILASLLIFPLFTTQLGNSKVALAQVANWKAVLGTVNLKNLLLIPLKFFVGRVSFEPKALYWSISGLWTLSLLVILGNAATPGSGENKVDSGQTRMTLVFLSLVPIVLGLLASFITPLLQYFRFIYLLVPLCVLIALGVNKWTKWIVVTGFLAFSLSYLLVPQFHREDWKSLTKSLPTNSNVCMIASSSDPLLYYRKDIKILDLKRQITPTRCNFVIPYTTEIHGVDYKTTFLKQGLKLVRERSFRELTLETWTK